MDDIPRDQSDEGGEAPCFAHLLDETVVGSGTGHFEVVDLGAVAAGGDGVAWSASPEGLHVNLVVLGSGANVGAHRNDDVDVLVVMVEGDATITVDGTAHTVRAGCAGVVPKGAVRAVTAGPAGVRYLSIHRARGPLGIRARDRSET